MGERRVRIDAPIKQPQRSATAQKEQHSKNSKKGLTEKDDEKQGSAVMEIMRGECWRKEGLAEVKNWSFL